MIEMVPNPFTIDYRVIPAEGVKSLVWMNGSLMDWTCGNVRYELNGSKHGPTVCYPYRFDAAHVSPSGHFVALYERLGTKAIILGPDNLFREVNRSYYHADVYEYPILFFRLADGREALAHCPEEYCELRIEDPVTGNPWTVKGAGHIDSLFHSRLAANPAGNRILSAGWFWHPSDTAYVFDLRLTTEGQVRLEICDDGCGQTAEISTAAFNKLGQLVISSAKGADDFREDEPGERLRPGMVGVYDLDEKKLISLAPLEDEAGTVMPVGNQHVVGFFDHPKLIDLETGRVKCRWPELKTGEQASSIIYHKPLPPPIALDSASGRFAVADGKQIVVVCLAPELLN